MALSCAVKVDYIITCRNEIREATDVPLLLFQEVSSERYRAMLELDIYRDFMPPKFQVIDYVIGSKTHFRCLDPQNSITKSRRVQIQISTDFSLFSPPKNCFIMKRLDEEIPSLHVK